MEPGRYFKLKLTFLVISSSSSSSSFLYFSHTRIVLSGRWFKKRHTKVFLIVLKIIAECTFIQKFFLKQRHFVPLIKGTLNIINNYATTLDLRAFNNTGPSGSFLRKFQASVLVMLWTGWSFTEMISSPSSNWPSLSAAPPEITE